MKKRIWAVFESSDLPIGNASAASLDCIASFDTEDEAIDCQLANASYRIRKLVPLPETAGGQA